MKLYRLLFILFTFSFGSSMAQKDLTAYMIFHPQKINVERQTVAWTPAEAKSLETILLQEENRNLFLGLTSIKTVVDVGGRNIEIDVRVEESLQNHDEYRLNISSSSIRVLAKNKRTLQYARQTLLHLINYVNLENKDLPKIKIQDWANFERRAYMLDISRDKVPTMKSLYELIDQLSEWRFNEFQLYIEHTFAYKNHKIVWEHASPITAEEIQKLNKYCLERGIDLVPNQNSFGHMENWLKHDQYLDLCECETDCKTIWGNRKRTALAPTNPNSFKLIQELYAELLPNFTSQYFNIGGDETVELGLGKSKQLSDQIGKGTVYLDFLKKLNQEVNFHNKKAQFWGDIVLNHPELIKDIPKDMTALVWGYEAEYPFNTNLPKFKSAGLEFYVCPGTSTWRSEIGRNHNAFLNLKNAAIEGKKHGAKGFMITDWGDYGHFQPKSVSYPSLILGAAYAWNYSNKTLNNLEFLLNQYVFQDSTGYSAKAILTLGNAYLKANIPNGNANAFHLMIRRYAWTMDGQYQTKQLNKKGLLAAEEEIDKGMEMLLKAQPQCADGDIILKELALASQLAKFGIHLGLARLETKDKSTKEIPQSKKQALIQELEPLIKSHQEIWIVRNRPGGLKDSAEKLEDVLNYLQNN